MSSRIWRRLQTYRRLGLQSVANVVCYRLACRLGYYRWLQPVLNWPDGNSVFFEVCNEGIAREGGTTGNILAQADRLLEGDFTYFSRHRASIGAPPDWFLDPFSESRIKGDTHWSRVSEFASNDIKIVWEPSRFGWSLVFAQAYLENREKKYLDALNAWLNDWLRHNPLNAGPNWKCGQEASLRVMNLAMTALLLGQVDTANEQLLSLVRAHLARIAPTLRYAMAQDNNHGTSEAAALYIGGSWLELLAPGNESRKWFRLGCRWLENRAFRLIGNDGSFSQYSVNYHRVVLDTLSMVEVWRRFMRLPAFSSAFREKCQAAMGWLYAVVDPESGDAPNLGANDGARLLTLSNSDYRDFRPSVQLASMLFNNQRAYPEGPWERPAVLLGVDPVSDGQLPIPGPKVYPDGGYVVLKQSTETFGVLRFANFRFRPGHADCLHFDLWHRGVNILRDGGTYSYNTDADLMDYLSGTASHNTVQFDDRNQMPRLSRFLFGDWLKMSEVSEIVQVEGALVWSGAYTDGSGASHKRTIESTGLRWLVKDEISGVRNKAVLRWRLAPDVWELKQNTCTGNSLTLSVESSTKVRRMELGSGWESRYFLEKTELPVLEVEVGSGSTVLKTVIELRQ